jgi:hypothetical protein
METKLETAKRYAETARNKSIENNGLNTETLSKKLHFLRRIKSNRKLQIIIGICLLAIVVLIYHNNTQKQQWACLQRIEYDRPDYSYNSAKGGYLDFKTQKEALDYCFTEMKYYKF